MFRPCCSRSARAAAACAPALAALWAALSGCAAQSGFADVKTLVKERVHADARWYGQGERAHAQRGVERLLAAPLSATQAVQIAIWNSYELQAAFDELGIARAALEAATLPPNPELEGRILFIDDERPKLGFALIESLSELLFLPYRSDVAEADLAAERVRAAGAAVDLAFAVRRAFYDYQAAEQTLDLWRTVLEASDVSFAFAERLATAGNITRLDLDSERAFREEARVSVDGAEVNAGNQREALNQLLGLGGRAAAAWTLAGPLGDPDPQLPALPELERRAVAQSLELRELALRSKAEAGRADLAQVRGVLPDLRAGVDVEREEHWEVGPMVALELPLFDHGQAETARAQARQQQIEHRRAGHAVALRAAVRAARQQLAVAIRTVAQYRDVLLPMRARILDETLRQYNAMQVGVFQLLAAKREQVQTGRGYVAALRDYWVTRAALDSLLAGRLMRPPQLGMGAMDGGASMQHAGVGAGGH
jgi:outer membrane protein, heavy metal efflux system